MNYADPIADAAEYMEGASRRGSALAKAREQAELDIRMAFLSHFSGTEGVKIWRTDRDDWLIAVPAIEAIESVHDYDKPCAAWHAMLTGHGTLDQYREALIAQFVYLHADDVAEAYVEVEA
jgi:hypothetical protein